MKTILALFAVLSLLLSAFAVARPVIANHEPPDGPEVPPESQTFPTGGPTCLDIDGIAVTDGTAIRFGDSADDAGPLEDEATATVTLSDGSEATVQIFLEEDEGEFVSLTFVVEGGLAALVKVTGANVENIYDYTDFTGGGVAHDDGLVTATGQEISHIDFCLVPVDASIIVYKTDQTGADVAGAEFTVFDGETAVAGPALTDADGLVCFDGLVLDKVYTVVETDTPDGWLPADPDNQDHEGVQGDCEDREGAGPDLTFTNTLLGSLLVRKLDDGEPAVGLPGAEFTITGPDEFETTATSDANGWFCLDGLVFGEEYTVTETAAPDGYVIAGDNPQSHTIDDTATCDERIAESPTADLVFVNSEELGSITIIKEIECEVCETLTIGYWFNAAGAHDDHTNALLSAGIEADGETFTSADQVRAYVVADISGASDGQPGLSHRGQLTIQYLAAVLNVLNNGEECELAERVFNDPESPFDGWTVGEILDEAESAFDGTSSFSDEEIKDALDAINNSTQAEENPLTCGEGTEGGTLDGVEFTIYLASEYPDGTPEGTGTTGDDGAGTVVFDGLTIGEDYVIVETGFPEGLTCEIVGVSEPATLVDGVIEVTLSEEDLDESLNLSLTVENDCEEEQEEELGSLLIAKTDDSEEPMLVGGATFEVDGVAHADEDGDGWVCVDGLTLGDTVAVEETVAPDGYIGQEGIVDVPVTSTDDCETRLAAAEPMPDVTFVNVLEEGQGLVEIDKFFCITSGEARTQFIVSDPIVPEALGSIQGEEEEQQPEEGCFTEAVSFTITGGDLTEPVEVTTNENGIIEFPLPDSENPYTITEDASGDSAQFFVEDGAITAILVINWLEEEEGTGLLKVIKLFCIGEEAGVEFSVEGGDVPTPVLEDCEVGDATFELGEDTFSVGDDGIAILVVEVGDYSFAETDPNEAEYDGTITIEEGEITTVIVFNTSTEGEQGGGVSPGEGTLGGQVPNTATAPELTGSLAAALLALVMLTGLGAAGYRMRAEARRRR